MQKENVVKVIIGRVKPDVKISCHAELVSASSTLVVSQRNNNDQRGGSTTRPRITTLRGAAKW